MRVREATAADRDWIERFLDDHGSRRVARNGELVMPLDHPMLVAETDGGQPAGLLTYVIAGDECEILTLHSVKQWQGAGTRLIAGALDLARRCGCRRLWLVTTNDNVDALRFYQRRGFRLVALRSGTVDDARATLKPEIPRTGDHGIPLRDELELELELDFAEGDR
jgi:N-acetylglutamate synthase-like GNAT family acetyltransferase